MLKVQPTFRSSKCRARTLKWAELSSYAIQGGFCFQVCRGDQMQASAKDLPVELMFVMLCRVALIVTKLLRKLSCGADAYTFESSSYFRGTQREYSSKPLKHSNVERILVFKR